MTDQELMAKLEQIEEHARLTLSDYPQRDLVRERQRMIIALTKYLRTELSLRTWSRPPESADPPAVGDDRAH